MSQTDSILGWKRKSCESVITEKWKEIQQTCELLFEENFNDFFPDEFKRTRESTPQIMLETSCWGQMLSDPTLHITGSIISTKFRRRFRVPPFIFFNVLIPLCRNRKIFNADSHKGRRHIPLEFKLLVALRMLGRGSVADDCSEMSGIAESTCSSIFQQFVLNFCQTYYNDFVTFPRKIPDLLKMMEVYRKLGLPGCIGSIDVTHVHWDKCPKELRHEHIGKEGYPSLAFQVIVNHSRLILHVSHSFMGSYNDITISRNDPLAVAIMDEMVYKNIPYGLYNDHGDICIHEGPYLLADNGYLKVASLICPMKIASNRNELIWSEWVESVRKDVECLFGVLKARFCYLKNPIRTHTPHIIEAAFKCCAILHNMLLIYDQGELEYNTIDDWDTVEDELVVNNNPNEDLLDDSSTLDINLNVSPMMNLTMTDIYERKDDLPRGESFEPNDFEEKRKKLVQHLSTQFFNNQLQWPKEMKGTSKNILRRVAQQSHVT